jgi:hypothetical protein
MLARLIVAMVVMMCASCTSCDENGNSSDARSSTDSGAQVVTPPSECLICPSTPGPRGERGEQGDRGQKGPEGLPGRRGDVGPQGPKGERGPQGETGPEGPQGPIGKTGSQGPEGPQGLNGATGAQGLQGIPGSQGERGPKGDQGERGGQGPQGEEGPMGPPGPKGDKGEQGPPGSIPEASCPPGSTELSIDGELTYCHFFPFGLELTSRQECFWRCHELGMQFVRLEDMMLICRANPDFYEGENMDEVWFWFRLVSLYNTYFANSNMGTAMMVRTRARLCYQSYGFCDMALERPIQCYDPVTGDPVTGEMAMMWNFIGGTGSGNSIRREIRTNDEGIEYKILVAQCQCGVRPIRSHVRSQ